MPLSMTITIEEQAIKFPLYINIPHSTKLLKFSMDPSDVPVSYFRHVLTHSWAKLLLSFAGFKRAPES